MYEIEKIYFLHIKLISRQRNMMPEIPLQFELRCSYTYFSLALLKNLKTFAPIPYVRAICFYQTDSYNTIVSGIHVHNSV